MIEFNFIIRYKHTKSILLGQWEFVSLDIDDQSNSLLILFSNNSQTFKKNYLYSTYFTENMSKVA